MVVRRGTIGMKAAFVFLEFDDASLSDACLARPQLTGLQDACLDLLILSNVTQFFEAFTAFY